MSRRTRSKRRVSLNGNVAVIPIAQRTEYSSLVRERIWSSASELYQNAARNALEFAAEGFDWRNVADDEQMVHSPSHRIAKAWVLDETTKSFLKAKCASHFYHFWGALLTTEQCGPMPDEYGKEYKNEGLFAWTTTPAGNKWVTSSVKSQDLGCI